MKKHDGKKCDMAMKEKEAHKDGKHKHAAVKKPHKGRKSEHKPK